MKGPRTRTCDASAALTRARDAAQTLLGGVVVSITRVAHTSRGGVLAETAVRAVWIVLMELYKHTHTYTHTHIHTNSDKVTDAH